MAGKIEKNTTVILNYTICDSFGKILDDIYTKTPVNITYGEGKLPPGLEEGIKGFVTGDKKSVVVFPEKAFGERKKDLIIKVKKNTLPAVEFVKGKSFVRLDKFGQFQKYVISGFIGDWVYLDSNHPFAGKTIVYNVSIVSIKKKHGVDHNIGHNMSNRKCISEIKTKPKNRNRNSHKT